jgi:hypothetical protein
MAFSGINSFTAIGPQSVFWAAALNGLPYGTTGTIAAGASAGMGRLKGVKSLELTEPDAESLVPTGDNGALDPFILQPNTAPTGTLTTSVRDQVFFTKSNGMKIATTGTRDLMGLIPACYNYGQIQLLVNSPAKSAETATIGEDGYVVNGLMSVRNNSKSITTMTERAIRDWTNNLVFSRSSKTMWGETWVTATHGSTSFVGFEFSSPYPIHIMTFIGDGTEDEVTLSETLAEDSAANIQVWRAGTSLVFTTAFTADIATNKVTFVAPPAADTINIIVYGFVPGC